MSQSHQARSNKAMSKISDLPDFDMARYLDSNAAVAEYLTQVLADKNPPELVVALSDIARTDLTFSRSPHELRAT